MAISSRVNSYGEVPVYCRLTLNQKQKQFMIGCTVPLVIWEQAKQHAKGKTSKAETVNLQIKLVLQKIYNAHAELIKLGELFEVEDILSNVSHRPTPSCNHLALSIFLCT